MVKLLKKNINTLKKFLRTFPLTQHFYKGLHSLRRYGIKVTWHKSKQIILRRKEAQSIAPTTFELTDKERAKQQSKTFAKNITISIITPLYNTPEKYLIEMIESVKAQTYQNWQLCLADGSDTNHDYITKICNKYANKDTRIKYKKLVKNEGISGNTNKAMEMATGDYFAMLDHDDWLHPTALYETMCAICDKNADFIYTDEAIFNNHPDDSFNIYFKPAFSPDTLRGVNYICHLSVYSRALQQKVGLYNSQYDGSQDHDMTLRITEKADTIVHIPKILYYWRSHAGSVVQTLDVKPYAIDAGIAAVASQIKRLRLPGTVESAWQGASHYRIRYELKDNPIISIVVSNNGSESSLKKCLDSISNKTSYKNIEVLVTENGFDFFDLTSASGKYLVFLDSGTEIITPDWLQEMLMFAQRKDVGVVGAKLYHPNDTIKHAGIILGEEGERIPMHRHFPKEDHGHLGLLKIANNPSVVSEACMMLSREVFKEICFVGARSARPRATDGRPYIWQISSRVGINGTDEKSNIDICSRIRQKGYLVVFTPFAELYHHETEVI